MGMQSLLTASALGAAILFGTTSLAGAQGYGHRGGMGFNRPAMTPMGAGYGRVPMGYGRTGPTFTHATGYGRPTGFGPRFVHGGGYGSARPYAGIWGYQRRFGPRPYGLGFATGAAIGATAAYAATGYATGGYGYGYGYRSGYASYATTAPATAQVYSVPRTVYTPVTRTSLVPVTSYQAVQTTQIVPQTVYQQYQRVCQCQDVPLGTTTGYGGYGTGYVGGSSVIYNRPGLFTSY